MVRRVASALFVVTLLGMLASGPRPVAAQQPAGTVEVTGTSLVDQSLTASLAVLDGAGNPVLGLTPEDFSIQVDGIIVDAAVIESGVDSALPLGIVLTVDTSGSMAGEALQSAKGAILPLVGELQASDQAALVTFANEVIEVVPLTGDAIALSGAIDGMAASGNTALFAAVVRASEAARLAPQPRRAVVILSDGEDFGSVSGDVTSTDALNAAASSGVPFFVVGLGQDVDQPFLTSLATATGGQYLAAADPGQLAQLYGRISQRLRQQYTVSLSLPADLPGGEHRLTITAGGVQGFATFETEAIAPVPRLSIVGLPEELREPTTVTVSGAPAGATVRFEIDGRSVDASNGRDLSIDPYLYAPGEHSLVVTTEQDGPLAFETTFKVPALPPVLLAPAEIPGLRTGDLVRLTIKAQPGTTTVRARVDGAEVYLDSDPPFEFVLPEDDYGSGTHQLSIRVEAEGGADERSFAFEGPSEAGTNYAAYVLLGAALLAVAAVVIYSGRRTYAWVRNRPEPVDVAGVADQLAAWSELRRGRGDTGAESSPEVSASPTDAWGSLRVLSGPDAGKSFDLRDDTELVGKGRFCSIRLSDPKLEEAHFVLSRNGRLSASTPTARVMVDGAEVRTVLLTERAAIAVGSSEIEVGLVATAESEA